MLLENKLSCLLYEASHFFIGIVFRRLRSNLPLYYYLFSSQYQRVELYYYPIIEPTVVIAYISILIVTPQPCRDVSVIKQSS